MSSPSLFSTSLWMVLALAAALEAAGLYLLFTGLRPRRRGHTPFCRKCGYNLTGVPDSALAVEGPMAAAPSEDSVPVAPTTRCPECGADLHASAIVHGERRTRKARVAAGVLLMAISSAAVALHVTGVLSHIDWYRHYRAGWVFDDLASADKTVSGRAFVELRRRTLARSLSQDQLDRFVDECLDVQAGPLESGPFKTNYRGPEPVVLLDQLYRDGALSAEQSERFFETMLVFELHLRPRVGRGGPAVAMIPREYHGARDAFAVRCGSIELTVDGSPYAPVSEVELGRGAIASFPSLYNLPLSLGRHEITARTAFAIHHATPDGAAETAPVYNGPRTLSGSYDVLDVASADLIKLKRSPELDRRMLQAISLERLTGFRMGGDRIGWGFNGRVLLAEDAPLPVAFHVTVDFPDGGDVPSVVFSRDLDIAPHRLDRVGSGQFSAGTTVKEPERVTITLTPNPAHAARTTDLYEIWGGSIRFEDVPIGGAAGTTRGRLIETDEPPLRP